MRVGVVDQRGELGAAYRGQAQLDLGRHTDLLSGSPKAAGLMLLLRAMNPQVLAVDEVTAPEDVHALLTAGGCGVSLLATVHGTDRTDLDVTAKLNGAGCTQTVFEENALEAILNAANGTPRMINKLCNASLLVGNSSNLNIITADAVMQAINDCELG